jgi:hypothetical protein
MANDSIELKPVKSSNIKAVGYDPTTLTLRIQYKTDRVYNYFGVPVEIYTNLMAAESVGKFFWANIRTQYAFAEVK